MNHSERAASRKRWHANKDRWNAAKRLKRRTNDAWRKEEGLRDVVRRQARGEPFGERLAQWSADNPDKHADYLRRKAIRHAERRKAYKVRKDRKQALKRCKDQDALQHRLISRIDTLVPRQLPAFARGSIIALMVVRTYGGLLPMRLTKDHAAAAVAEITGKAGAAL